MTNGNNPKPKKEIKSNVSMYKLIYLGKINFIPIMHPNKTTIDNKNLIVFLN